MCQLDHFLIEDLHPVMILDASLASHSIVQMVGHPDEITELFDTISYNKVCLCCSALFDTSYNKVCLCYSALFDTFSYNKVCLCCSALFDTIWYNKVCLCCSALFDTFSYNKVCLCYSALFDTFSYNKVCLCCSALFDLVNTTIQQWNQLAAEVLEILPCKPITFKKRVSKVIIELH